MSVTQLFGGARSPEPGARAVDADDPGQQPGVAVVLAELRATLAALDGPSARWRRTLAGLGDAQAGRGTVVDLTARAAYDEVFDLMERISALVDPYLAEDVAGPA